MLKDFKKVNSEYMAIPTNPLDNSIGMIFIRKNYKSQRVNIQVATFNQDKLTLLFRNYYQANTIEFNDFKTAKKMLDNFFNYNNIKYIIKHNKTLYYYNKYKIEKINYIKNPTSQNKKLSYYWIINQDRNNKYYNLKDVVKYLNSHSTLTS